MSNSIKSQSGQSLLIISAHADDHVACAGTVFKLQKERGYRSYEIVCTDSALGQNFAVDEEIAMDTVRDTRRAELSEASKFLGIHETFQLGQPDLGLKYDSGLMFKIVKIIRTVRPGIVFIHNSYDAHPDHRAAHELSVHALKISAMGVKKETLGEPHRAPIVLCAEGMLPIQSCIVVDVTKYAQMKQELFAIYGSQASPQAMSFEEGLGRVRGYHVRMKDALHAEAFDLQNQFPIVLFHEDVPI